jgi:hypothetical protein
MRCLLPFLSSYRVPPSVFQHRGRVFRTLFAAEINRDVCVGDRAAPEKMSWNARGTHGYTALTEIVYAAKVGKPLFNDLPAASLNDFHDVVQCPFWNAGIIMAKTAFSCPGNPNLCRVCAGHSLANVDMDRLQRLVFIRPEKYPV